MSLILPGFLHDRGPAVACRVYNTANISIASATATAMTFDSESEDPWGFHSTASNTDQLVVPVGFDGYYTFFGTVTFDNTSALNGRYASIRLNGSSTILVADARAGSVAFQPIISIAGGARLVAGDVLRLYGYQDSGISINAVASGVWGIAFGMAFQGR